MAIFVKIIENEREAFRVKCDDSTNTALQLETVRDRTLVYITHQ